MPILGAALVTNGYSRIIQGRPKIRFRSRFPYRKHQNQINLDNIIDFLHIVGIMMSLYPKITESRGSKLYFEMTFKPNSFYVKPRNWQCKLEVCIVNLQTVNSLKVCIILFYSNNKRLYIHGETVYSSQNILKI